MGDRQNSHQPLSPPRTLGGIDIAVCRGAAGTAQTFDALAESYFRAYCETADLLLSPEDELGRFACSFSDVKRSCTVLQKFEINNEMLELSWHYQLTGVPDKMDKPLLIDLLLSTPHAGITCIIRVPDRASNLKAFLNPSMKRRMKIVHSWLEELSGSAKACYCLLLGAHSPIDTSNCPLVRYEDGTEVECSVLKSMQLEELRQGIYSDDRCNNDLAAHRELSKRLVALWCNVTFRNEVSENMMNDAIDRNEKPATIHEFVAQSKRYADDVMHVWDRKDRNEIIMVPPIFQARHNSPFIRKKDHDAPPWAPKATPAIEGKLRGDDGELKVFEAIETFCNRSERLSQPLVAISGFEVDARVRKQLGSIIKLSRDCEMDFVCISPEIGVLLIEVKSIDDDTGENRVEHAFRDATNQVQDFQNLLGELCEQLSIELPENSCSLAVAFPFYSLETLKELIPDVEIRAEQANVTLLCDPLSIEHFVTKGIRSPLSRWVTKTDTLYDRLTPILVNMYAIASKRQLPRINITQCTSDTTNQITHQMVVSLSDRPPQGFLKAGKNSEKNPGHDTKSIRALNVYFLTPEQMQIWTGPRHQLIEGCAGTGKTILLMARVLEEVSAGRRVIVFSKSPTNRLYESFARSNGVADSVRSFHYGEMTNMFPKFFGTLNSERIFRQPGHKLVMDVMCKQAISPNSDVYAELVGMSQACILMDDALSCASDQSLLFRIRMLAHCALTNNLFSLCWVAVNSRIGNIKLNAWNTHMNYLLSNFALGGNVHVGQLSTVMRVASNIYPSSHCLRLVSGDVKSTKIGRIGHNIIGRTPETIRVPTELLRKQELPVVLNDVKAQESQGIYAGRVRDICGHIKSKLDLLLPACGNQECKRSLSLSDACVILSHRFASFKEDIATELGHLGYAVSDIENQQLEKIDGKDTLAVDLSSSAHSFEWAVVFYVYSNYTEKKYEKGLKTFMALEKHLARSRCTTVLVNIKLYPANGAADSSDEGRDDAAASTSSGKRGCCLII